MIASAIKAEILKIFTTRLWWGLLIGDVLIGGLLSFAFAFQLGQTDSSDSPTAAIMSHPNVAAAQAIYSAGFTVTLAELFPLALGVILITAEFRHKTWTSTVLSTPLRWPISVAKAIAICVVGFVYAVVYDVAAVVGGGITMSVWRHSGLYLGSAEVWQTLGLIVLAFIIWTLLGFGFGLLLRNQIVAVFVGIGLAFIGNILFSIIFSLLHWDWAPKFLPSNLTSSMLNPTFASDPANHTFAWGWAAVVLTIYGLVLAGAGAVLNQRKDVL
ncbi:hypothetical protein [Leekyejoonella antrihumi]|uniref:ABC transporter permease n=1 Tax=Leekyejoonella antrihumi TaxID=1660198 RepID=A0A563E2K0_9MICO|nr:hypothetical protein [Leekyejoonella antrihumi]TWP36473.1 hypothetical protein FGL98_09640 [Leekyejoonella antrihumi]